MLLISPRSHALAAASLGNPLFLIKARMQVVTPAHSKDFIRMTVHTFRPTPLLYPSARNIIIRPVFTKCAYKFTVLN